MAVPASPGTPSKRLLALDDHPEDIQPKRKLERRPSFVAKVAAAAGFDWELLKEVLGQRHVWMFLLYICLTTLGIAIANFSLSLWLKEDIGFAEDDIGNAMAFMSVGCFLFSLPMGYLFDAVPQKRVMLFIAAAACAFCNLALVFCHTDLEAYWGLFGFGAAHGAIFVVQYSMARILADSRIAAAFFGIVNSCCNLMHALGTAMTGYLVEGGCPVEEPCNDYVLSFWVAAAVDFSALAFVFLIPGEHLKVHDGDGLKVLPHRKDLEFIKPVPVAAEAEAEEKRSSGLASVGSGRFTAMNTTAVELSAPGSASGGFDSVVVVNGAMKGDDIMTFQSPLSMARTRAAAAAASPKAGQGQPPAPSGPTVTYKGVQMSESLADFLAKSSAKGLSSGQELYAPPSSTAPAFVPHTAASTRALATFGVGGDPSQQLPMLDRLVQQFLAAPQSDRAPRPGDGREGSASGALDTVWNNRRGSVASTLVSSRGEGEEGRRRRLQCPLGRSPLPLAAACALGRQSRQRGAHLQ